MTPEQAEQWRHARALLDQLLDLDPSAQRLFIQSLDVESGVHEKLQRLLDADRSPEEDLGDATPLALLLDDAEVSLTGRQIGPWVLEQAIGEGGMSTVYQCRRDTEEYQQAGALKLLRMALLTRDGRLRFEQEKRILAGLRHPHIAGLLDAGTADDRTPYIVLELVDGRPIDGYVRQHKLSPRQTTALMVKVCRAVAFAQQSLIVHRDIKPSNILVDTQGEPRLLDFGIARLIADDAAAATTTRAYTPGYAAPEQLNGQPITTATDVFGLGATLFRLLTGRPLYDKASEHKLPVLQFGPDIDRDLRNIIGMAVEADPQRRYRDAAALADDLSRWLASRPVQATGRSARYALAKFASRHKFGVTASVLLMLTAVAGVTTTAWQAQRASQQAAVALRESQQAQAVRDFLIQLFEASAGGQVQDELPTTAQLLERAARQAREAYDDRPALKAEMLKVTGTIYGTQGRYAEAASLLSQALDVYRSLPQRSPLEEARILTWLARSLANADRDADAVAPAQAAFELADPTVAEQLVVREDAADVLIGALIDISDYDQARTVARKVYDEVRQYSPGDEFLNARSAHTLAIVLSNMGQSEAAIKPLEEAWQSIRGAEGRMVLKATIANSLAIALGRAQRHEAALPLARESVAIARSAYAPGHPRIGRALNNLSSVLAETGRLQEAADISAQALEILTTTLGKDHLSVAAGHNNLGSLYADLDRHAEALEAYSEASRIVAAKMGEQDWRRGVLQINQADSQIELGQYDAAARLIDQAEQVALTARREDQVAKAVSMRAKLYSRSDQSEKARAAAAQAVALGRKLYPQGAGLTAQNLARLLALAVAPGRPDEELKPLQMELQRLAGNYDRAARNAIRLRTDYLVERDRTDEAATLLQSDLDALLQTLDPGHPTVQLLERWLADTRSEGLDSG